MQKHKTLQNRVEDEELHTTF